MVTAVAMAASPAAGTIMQGRHMAQTAHAIHPTQATHTQQSAMGTSPSISILSPPII